MKITVITLFPQMVECFVKQSIVARAIEKHQVEVEIVNLRDFAKDYYGTVDDRPYGGGAGMILMAEPIYKAIKSSKSQIPSSKQIQNSNIKIQNKINQQPATSNKPTRNGGQFIILTSPRGKVYNQTIARKFSKLDHLIVVAGHYEGVDARVSKYVDERVSLGDFVMTGGEITAAAIIDSVVRLVPGVLKNVDATEEESFMQISINRLIEAVGENIILQRLKKKGVGKVTLLEYPQYTRPKQYARLKVPEVLLSGDHKQIEKWRLEQAFNLTKKLRPELLEL